MNHPWISRTGRNMPALFRSCLALATTDFCPSWNRYLRAVYRPIGWLPIATAISGLLAVMVAPTLWTIAGGLLGLWLLGLVWPLLSMLGVTAAWRGAAARVVEGETLRIGLRIRNRWPMPLFGLSVVVDDAPNAPSDQSPPLALSQVAGWSQATYELPWRVPVVGWLPNGSPRLECGFPFDVYRRHKAIHVEQATLVVPWSLELDRSRPSSASGTHLGLGPAGGPPGREGELTGLRPWFEGDSWRQIHWAQSARHGTWIVKQGALPMQPQIHLALSTNLPISLNLLETNQRILRRWLASIGRTLLAQGVRLKLYQARQWRDCGQGPEGLDALLELLATAEFDSLIVDATDRRGPGKGEELWLFQLGDAVFSERVAHDRASSVWSLPDHWSSDSLPDWSDLEAELAWCEREFPTYWHHCLSLEDRRVIA